MSANRGGGYLFVGEFGRRAAVDDVDAAQEHPRRVGGGEFERGSAQGRPAL
jgi:hypothetical protein